MAETQLAQARANLNTARARLGYATITAPRDGVLITRNVERGSVVQPGKALLVLAPAGDTPARGADRREESRPARARPDALWPRPTPIPTRRFNATLSYINPVVDITRASVEVKLAVTEPPDYLRQDMTVSVDIAVARRDDAVVAAGARGARCGHRALGC